jgi:hypothetical protein
MTDSIINYSRRLILETENWSVEKIVSHYIPPAELGAPGRLELPPWQREWSWKNTTGLAKMRALIDSVFYGFPIPAIQLIEQEDEHRERWWINDGRHRAETLWRFKNNKFSILVGDREVLYRDLSAPDARVFNERVIPVMKTTGTTLPQQKRDIFRRLNAGQPLANKDFLWMARDSTLAKIAISVLEEYAERLSETFGSVNALSRDQLPNWIGIAVAITTNEAGNMTTSFKRINEFLDSPLDTDGFREALDALLLLYSRAGLAERGFAKLGNVNAFFLADWMKAPVGERETVFLNWLRVLSLESSDRKALLKVSGAQNLNAKKLSTIRARVQRWLLDGTIEDDVLVEDSDSDVD